MKNIHTPDDPRKSAKVSSDQTMPHAHNGQLSSWLFCGPDVIYGKFDLGNFTSDRLVISVDTYGPGGWTGSHAHNAMEQAYYVIGGQAEITIGDETRVVGPGSSGFMARNVPHHFRNAGETDLVIAVISSILADDLATRPNLQGI